MKKAVVGLLVIFCFVGCGPANILWYKKKSEIDRKQPDYNRSFNYHWETELTEDYVLQFHPYNFILIGGIIAGNAIYFNQKN